MKDRFRTRARQSSVSKSQPEVQEATKTPEALQKETKHKAGGLLNYNLAAKIQQSSRALLGKSAKSNEESTHQLDGVKAPESENRSGGGERIRHEEQPIQLGWNSWEIEQKPTEAGKTEPDREEGEPVEREAEVNVEIQEALRHIALNNTVEERKDPLDIGGLEDGAMQNVKRGEELFTPGMLVQDVSLWNQRRRDTPESPPDLHDAELAGAVLKEANLSKVDLSGADLRSTALNSADLRSANLSKANLSGASLRGANLRGADLRNASLFRANLIHADLSEANLSGADLREAVLHSTNLRDAILDEIMLYRTIFADVDLSTAKGLEAVKHLGDSVIGIETITRSQGSIPPTFLRGAGVEEAVITTLRNPRPEEEQPGEKKEESGELLDDINCIFYTDTDAAFAERLAVDLQNRGVTCRLMACDEISEEELRFLAYDRLLLILSKQAMQSAWIESVVEIAFDREARRSKRVLLLLRVDETPLMVSRSWAMVTKKWAVDGHMMQHVHDFTDWEWDDKGYQDALDELLQDIIIIA